MNKEFGKFTTVQGGIINIRFEDISYYGFTAANYEDINGEVIKYNNVLAIHMQDGSMILLKPRDEYYADLEKIFYHNEK